MNRWFSRFSRPLGSGADGPSCGDEEARLVLQLAGAAAHTAGARPYAPLATYLAGQAAAGLPPDLRLAALHRAIEAATAAGPAGGDAVAEAGPDRPG